VNLVIGPFVGDFEYEIFHFLPYVKWLTYVNNHKNIHLSIYSNRRFLYDWLSDESIYNVPDSLLRDELHQVRYIHKELKQKDFQKLCKDFKSHICSKLNCKLKDLTYYNVIYIKSQFQIPIYKKIYEPLPYTEKKEYNNKIVFIPHKKMKEENAYKILKKLKEFSDDVIVIGDMKCHLKEENLILKDSMYFQNVYSDILGSIKNSKAVITPNSHWSFISNIYNKPTFTWGKVPGQFKEDGIYNFDNKKCMSIFFERKSPIEGLVKTIEYFLKKYIL